MIYLIIEYINLAYLLIHDFLCVLLKIISPLLFSVGLITKMFNISTDNIVGINYTTLCFNKTILISNLW